MTRELRRVRIATPAPAGSQTGNRVTAERWAEHLRALGHEVELCEPAGEAAAPRPGELLVALHALRSAECIRSWKARAPHAPLVLVMTGTDLYRDIERHAAARQSLELADRIVVLHELGARRLEPALRDKVRVIAQSLPLVARAALAEPEHFELVCVGHMRAVKDSLRAAEALQLLPRRTQLRLVQIGAALEPELAQRATRLAALDSRYRWVGELEREEGLARMATARLALCTSLMEGGANSVVEAVAHEVPLLVSAIEANLGLLGEDYPGQFPAGDTRALATLLERCLDEPGFVGRLERACAERRPRFAPQVERAALEQLLRELP